MPYIDTTGSQAGSTLFVERTKDTILSLAVLLQAKFKVGFAGGRGGSIFWGTLTTPEGHIGHIEQRFIGNRRAPMSVNSFILWFSKNFYKMALATMVTIGSLFSKNKGPLFGCCTLLCL